MLIHASSRATPKIAVVPTNARRPRHADRNGERGQRPRTVLQEGHGRRRTAYSTTPAARSRSIPRSPAAGGERGGVGVGDEGRERWPPGAGDRLCGLTARRSRRGRRTAHPRGRQEGEGDEAQQGDEMVDVGSALSRSWKSRSEEVGLQEAQGGWRSAPAGLPSPDLARDQLGRLVEHGRDGHAAESPAAEGPPRTVPIQARSTTTPASRRE